MDLKTIFRLAKAFNALGWSVQEQLDQFLSEDSTDDLNPAAVREFERWIKDVQRAAGSEDDELNLDCENALAVIADGASDREMECPACGAAPGVPCPH